MAETASGYKVLLDKRTGHIVGAHLLGPEADELANVFVLAIRAGLDPGILKESLFVYPTQCILSSTCLDYSLPDIIRFRQRVTVSSRTLST